MRASSGRPAPPSSRVYIAFGIAAIFGLAVFLIWWGTSPRLRQGVVGEESTGQRTAERPAGVGTDENKPPAAPPAPAEPALPRGGSLTGSTDALELALVRLTQATLVRIQRGTDRVEPWLAESWTVSPDNRTYTLKLRPNVLWSDGEPFTADDAVAALASAFAPIPQTSEGPLVGKLGWPLTARAIDPLTLEIKFPVAFAPGLRLLDHHPIRPRHSSAENVGLGPFVREAARDSGSQTFVRNPHYWRQAPDGSPLPYLDGLTLVRESRGEADFRDAAVSPDDVEQIRKLEEAGKARVFDLGPGLDADAMWFSASAASPLRRDKSPAASDRPWLGSEMLRLAISMAVDRREYCKQVFFGACDPIAGPITPANASWFNPDMPMGRANPQIAKGMLAELGLRDRTGDGVLDDAARRPVRFSLLINRDLRSAARAATFIADALRGIGVQVDITPVSLATLRARRIKGNYEAIYDRIEMRDTDPAMNLDFWMSSGDAHPWNPARVKPAADWERQIDELMIKNVSTFDRIERLQAFVDAQKIYHQHMPAIFFGAPYVRIATGIRTLNATPSLLQPHLLWNAESLAALK